MFHCGLLWHQSGCIVPVTVLRKTIHSHMESTEATLYTLTKKDFFSTKYFRNRSQYYICSDFLCQINTFLLNRHIFQLIIFEWLSKFALNSYLVQLNSVYHTDCWIYLTFSPSFLLSIGKHLQRHQCISWSRRGRAGGWYKVTTCFCFVSRGKQHPCTTTLWGTSLVTSRANVYGVIRS